MTTSQRHQLGHLHLGPRPGNGLVHPHDLARNHRPVVLADRLGGRLDVAAARHVILEHLDETCREAVGVVYGHQPPGLPVLQHPAKRVEVTGHHGGARGHRLDQHDAEALAAGVRRAVDVGASHRGRLLRVADLAQETQMPGQWPGLLAQFLLVAAADDQYLDVGKALDQRRKCPDQRGHPLARLVEPAEEQYGLAGTRISVKPRR